MGAFVGFGMDFEYVDVYPGGFFALCERYRGRLSHVSVVGIDSTADAERFRREAPAGLPIVHHLSNVAPADVHGPNLARWSKQDAFSRVLGAVWCGEDVGIYSNGPYPLPYFAPPLFDADVADLVAARLAALMAEASVPMLAETPACAFVAGRIGLGEFFHRLVDRTGCRVVLDASHVFSYALARGESPRAVLASLPLESVWEAHVAGGTVSRAHAHRYQDTHSDPILEPVLELLGEAIERCPNLRAITYELGTRLPLPTIEADFERLARAISARGFVPRVEPPARPRSPRQHEVRS